MEKVDTAEKARMMRELQEQDFVVTELNEYLDNHPSDAAALERIYTMIQQRDDAYKKYVQLFGPLRASDSLEQASWLWAEQDFPWDV